MIGVKLRFMLEYEYIQPMTGMWPLAGQVVPPLWSHVGYQPPREALTTDF